MEVFQKALADILRKVPEQILTSIIGEKLQQQGIKLSKAKVRNIAKQLLSDPACTSLTIGSKKHASIILDTQDAEKAEKAIERVTASMLEKLTNKMSVNVLRTLKRTWKEHHAIDEAELAGFRRRLRKTWAKPLDLLGMLIKIAIEVGGGANARYRSKGQVETPHLVEVLTRLHARSCQVAQEVMTLIEAGFADAAMARWRTLHEIAMIAGFIQEHGERTAEKYSLHVHVETYRAAGVYQTHCSKLGYEPFDPGELQKMKEKFEELVSKFGEHFETEYGWATPELPGKPSFSRIEAAVKFEHFRPFYKMASHSVHANPKGVFYKLGIYGPGTVLLVGPSNTGFADPGQNTAITLTFVTAVVTAAVNQIEPNFDDNVALTIMSKLSDEIGLSFVETQKRVEEKTIQNMQRQSAAARSNRKTQTNSKIHGG